MRIRNVTAESVPKAMDLVREQMGPEAVILSTYKDLDSGQARVTAALEEAEFSDPDFETGGATLTAIGKIDQALLFHRIPQSCIDRLIDVVSSLATTDPVLALAGALDSELRFKDLASLTFERPLLLVGPPGAGKSSTAAKLCAIARIAGLEPRLFTLDAVKAGGLAQLSTFAEAIGIEATAAASMAELHDRLAAAPEDEPRVIDTAGANPFDERELMDLYTAARTADAEPVLILPASGDTAETAEIASAFAELGANLMIATKLDTSRRFGGLISALRASGMSILASSQSAHIVDGLKPVNPVSLARLILSPEGPTQISGPATGDLP